MVQSKCNANSTNYIPIAIKKFIYRYAILINGKIIENNIIGWKTALAHARIRSTNMFEKVKACEILNLWTGEIVSYQEAEKRAQTLKKARHWCNHI